jgi:ribosomal protein S12 methylthiotransferase accessory factor
MRWQRLRGRTEREALEAAAGQGVPRAVGEWPLLTPYQIDAVLHAYESVARGRARAPEGLAEADLALPRVTRVDLASLAVASFPLLPEPLCPDCARASLPAARPAALSAPLPAARLAPLPSPLPIARPGAPDHAAPHTGCAPASKPDPATYRSRGLHAHRLPSVALANPVCGALGGGTWVNPTSTTTAPVAGSNFVRGYAGLTDVTWSGQANRTTDSRVLALLEGFERYAGTHPRHGRPPLLASYRSLGPERALHPARVGLYGPALYASDPMLAPFDEDREIPWVRAYALTTGGEVLVPARLAHYGAGTDADNFVFECSNGCATGASSTEAAFHALLERVERDAFLLAWYARAPLTPLDLGTVPGRSVRAMRDRAALHGYEVHAYDTRVDLPVPVVTALAVRTDGGPGTLSFGAAAGFDPAATVEAALSEVLTYIPHLPNQVAERRAELEAMAGDFSLVRHLKDHAQLYGLPRMLPYAAHFLESGAPRPVREVYETWEKSRPRTRDLRTDLGHLVAALQDREITPLLIDQTTPEEAAAGLCTVNALTPGLLPIDFGWPRQRALTHPRLRTAGRATPLREKDLHRAPHPFP